MDIAVGIIIGAEFTAIIASLVDNLANPLIGLFLGRVNFTDMYAVLSGDVPQGTSLDAMRESGAGATVMRLRPGIVGRINPQLELSLASRFKASWGSDRRHTCGS